MRYTLAKKRIKNINIRFDRYGDVKVSAPIWLKDDEIEAFVATKKEWIESRQNAIKNALPRYINGERIAYFEHLYTLNLIACDRNCAFISGDILNIFTKDIADTKGIERIIMDFFARDSKPYINAIIDKYASAINREVVSIKFRYMRTRWGSCSTKSANIRLSTLLFAKPRVCLEYVLLHELIHLVHANHSRDFYYLLASLMPNWRKIKAILES